jgi:PAS domain S-box-containing protein
MQCQPIQSKKNRVRRFLGDFLARVPGRTFVPALALLPISDQPIAHAAAESESTLVIALACLGGLLGLSAAILYRHMHAEEEKLRLKIENTGAELRALLALTDDAVLVINSDGTVRDGNPAAEEMFGIPVDDIPGSPLTDLIAQPLCLGELTKHGPVSFQTTAKRPGDQFPQVDMVLSSTEVAGRNTYIALIRDCQPAPAAEKPPAVDLVQPVQKFTHDLNNELTTVIGNLSLILMAPPSDPQNHERVVGAKRTAVRAHNLVHKLQALVSGEEQDPESTPVTPAASKTNTTMPESEPAPKTSDVPAAATAKPRIPRILVLDDEEAICSLVSIALDSMGFEVTEALSVAPALKACEQAVREGRPYDIVISDLSLPGDMNGIEAVGRLRDIHPQIRAIVSSGYSADPIMGDCRRHGFAAAIAKPYDLAKLGRVVREVLASGPSTIFQNA